MKPDPPLCPGCGHKMRYKEPHGTYECGRRSCPVISVKADYVNGQWVFSRIKKNSIHGEIKKYGIG